MSSEKGQSMIELIVVVTVMVIVVGALVFATISSLRNARFASDQAQATKYAQEGLENVRKLRDRNDSSFTNLWGIALNCSPLNNCYYRFNTSGSLVVTSSTIFESIQPYFNRQILIEDYVDGTQQKKVTALVKWSDFAGAHESRITTILRKL